MSPQSPLVSADSAAILRLPKARCAACKAPDAQSARLEAKGHAPGISGRAHSSARTDPTPRGGAGSHIASGQVGQWAALLML